MFDWMIGSVSGVSFVVSPFFLAVFLYLAWITRRLLKRDVKAAPMGYVLLGSAMITLVVLLGHELSHALTAAFLGLPVTEIGLTFFGAYTEIPGMGEAPALAALLVGLAGSFFNLATVRPLILVSRRIRNELLSRTVWIVAYVSAFIGLLNLIPTRFLDGGKVILAVWRLVGIDPAGRLADVVDTAALFILFYFIINGPPKFLWKFIRRFTS